jgi:hypothetical protein
MTLGSCNPRTSLTVATHALEGNGFDEGASEIVLEWEKQWNEGEGRLNFAALCRAFGIIRQVGY